MALRSVQSQTGLTFDDFRPSPSTTSMQGGAAAAGSTVGDNFASLQANKPDYVAIGNAAIDSRAIIERAQDDAQTSTANARLLAEAQLEADQNLYDARIKAGEQKAGNAIFGQVLGAGATLLGSAFLSDERTKNTINSIDDALTKLRELRPVTFYYNEEYSAAFERLHHGFIAQEYKNVLPEATYYDESIDKYCIDTKELIALLVRGIQQLEQRVARMEATNALAGVKS